MSNHRTASETVLIKTNEKLRHQVAELQKQLELERRECHVYKKAIDKMNDLVNEIVEALDKTRNTASAEPGFIKISGTSAGQVYG